MSAIRITFNTGDLEAEEARKLVASRLLELAAIMRSSGKYDRYVSGFALGGEWTIRDLQTRKLLPIKFTTQLDASGYLDREHPDWDNSLFSLESALKPLYGDIDEL